jgi:D-alanyl-D-alanine carboxypeptidase
MARVKSKRVRTWLIIGAALVVLCAIALAVFLNLHNIYAWSEKNGFFKSDIAIKKAQIDNTKSYTPSELEADPRVTVDQSLMLINTEYLISEDFKPQISEYKDTTVYMNDCMLDAYAALSAAVKQKTRNKLYVSSDFRTAEEQEVLYEQDPLTATLPGASEHQTGLALDVYVAYYAGDAFIKSPSGRFVNSNSWKYGFIIRYPSHAEDVTGIRFEPWHIRYVGHPHADVIYNNHITLEEYILAFEIGEWYEIDGYLVCRQALTEDGSLTLPEQFESCVVSPDNTGYYIVTVK